MKLAIIGTGQIGMIYAEYANKYSDVEIIAIVDHLKKRRNFAAKQLNLSKEMLFDHVDSFFNQGKIADAGLVESEAKRISSFGNLSYFKKDNAPEKSGMRCMNCEATTSLVTVSFNLSMMAYAAEQSRTSGQIVDVDQLKSEISNSINADYKKCGDDKCD